QPSPFTPGRDARVDSEAVQRADQQAVDPCVRLALSARSSRRSGHAVGDLPMVQYRSAARGPTNDAEAASTNPFSVIVTQRRLVATEGNGGGGPRVDAQRPFVRAPRARHQRLVERHVLGSRGGGGNQDAPARVRHQANEKGVGAEGLTLT